MSASLPAAPIVTEEAARAERKAQRIQQPRHEDAVAGPEVGEWSISRIVQQHGSAGDYVETGRDSAGYFDRSGPAADAFTSAAWTIDDAYTRRSPTLADLMREFGPPPDPLAAFGVTRPQGRAAAPAPIWESINGVLRQVREAILDDTDAANFTLAGIELNLTLRSDRRSLTLNGYDVLPVVLGGAQGPEAARATPSHAAYGSFTPGGAGVALPVRVDDDTAPQPSVLLVQIRDFVFQPLTILTVIAVLALWIFLRVIHSARDKQSW